MSESTLEPEIVFRQSSAPGEPVTTEVVFRELGTEMEGYSFWRYTSPHKPSMRKFEVWVPTEHLNAYQSLNQET